ncbi:hypothetical protein EYF80_047899 [Liparis tanakae]|uniref:Uncharacterized protein n=1 Tax=Liparis tanakae TaxID=230148 RepID=A0A4Z2FLP1_9TELE|nr:hypothetical protein EYF80_047899 [Liparis tanakae]
MQLETRPRFDKHHEGERGPAGGPLLERSRRSNQLQAASQVRQSERGRSQIQEEELSSFANLKKNQRRRDIRREAAAFSQVHCGPGEEENVVRTFWVS